MRASGGVAGDSALDDVWDEVNAHLGTKAPSLPDLVGELGQRGGSASARGLAIHSAAAVRSPSRRARIGCDCYASDLNPIACLLTWGALNIIGGSAETREKIAEAQKTIVRALDEEFTRIGVEHDGGSRDVRLLADAPSRWPHGYRVDRAGRAGSSQPAPADHNKICPSTGWKVPMIETRQVNGRHGVVLEFVPEAATAGATVSKPEAGLTVSLGMRRKKAPSSVQMARFFRPQSRPRRGTRSHRQPRESVSLLRRDRGSEHGMARAARAELANQQELPNRCSARA